MYMGIAFFVMSVLQIPGLILAVIGDRMPPEWWDMMLVARTSLSNIGPRDLSSSLPVDSTASAACIDQERS